MSSRAYEVVAHLDHGVEIRAYAGRMAVQTPVRGGNDGEAFGRLFRYITGANQADAKIAMTVPVEQTARPIAMTVPVETTGSVMRFFLPQAVAGSGAAAAQRSARFRGQPAGAAIRRAAVFGCGGRCVAHQARAAIIGGGERARGGMRRGGASLFSYDPPFALPVSAAE